MDTEVADSFGMAVAEIITTRLGDPITQYPHLADL